MHLHIQYIPSQSLPVQLWLIPFKGTKIPQFSGQAINPVILI